MNATAMPITRIATPTVSNPRVTFSMTSLNVYRPSSHDRLIAARLHPARGIIVVPWPTTSATKALTGSSADAHATLGTGPPRRSVRPRSGSAKKANVADGCTF